MAKQKQQSIIEKLLQTEDVQLKRLHSLVADSIKEEESIVQHLLHPPNEKLTTGQRIADQVAHFGGSWSFILSFLGILVLWIAFNAVALTQPHFDPYPFILLNLVLSCIAALQAPVIMMAQNRTEEKDRERAQNDYMVNLKAELEIRGLHQKIDLLQEEQMHKLMEVQVLQLRLLDRLNRRVNTQAKAFSEHLGKPLVVDPESDVPIDFDALWKKK